MTTKVTGTSGADTLSADPGGSDVWGLGGADSLLGGTGVDTLRGGAGADTITGGGSYDSFAADDDAPGGDRQFDGDVITDYQVGEVIHTDYTNGIAYTDATAKIQVVGGDTFLQLDTDADGQFDTTITLRGVVGGALIIDGGFNLSIAGTLSPGTNGADTIAGTAGADTITGLGGDDHLVGLGDDDSLAGGGGSDTLQGGDGNDTLTAGSGGQEVLDGGAGNDSLLGTNGSGGTGGGILNGGDGDDTIVGSPLDMVSGGAGNDLLTASGEIDGGDGKDTHIGASGATRLTGDAGDDSLSGGDGSQILMGGTGADTMAGGAGADTFSGSFGPSGNELNGDVITDFGPTDVISFGSTVSGVKPVQLIDLGDGDSQLQIDGDHDGTYDTFITLEGVSHSDVVASGTGFVTTIQIVPITNQTLTGTAGPDTLAGGGGNDTISGGLGDDSLTGGAGNDSISNTGGADTIDGGTGADTIVDSGSGGSLISGGTDNLDRTLDHSYDKLTIDRSGATGNLAAAVDSTGFDGTNGFVSDGTGFSQLEQVSLRTGSGADTVGVSAADYSLGSVTVDTGGGVDLLNLDLHANPGLPLMTASMYVTASASSTVASTPRGAALATVTNAELVDVQLETSGQARSSATPASAMRPFMAAAAATA